MRRSMITLLALGAFAMAARQAMASPPPRQLLGELPIRFEENHGRARRDARFVAYGAGYLLSLAPSESRLEWTDPKTGKRMQVRTRFAGASSNPSMQPDDRLPGLANYFLGSSENWRTAVSGFGRIRYRELYPGIDLVFHGDHGQLEYDFVLAPNADPRAIRLEFHGQRNVRVSADGDLVVSAGSDAIRWKRPRIYQEAGGVQSPVDGRFVVSRNGAVGFEIGSYDRSRVLTIDPTLAYSTYLGGTGNDFARAIAIDGSGNVYIAGNTTSVDLPVVSAVQSSYGGGTASFLAGDAFVAKFNHAGTLVYLTYLGGSADDAALGIAVDAAGDAYIAGQTTSVNFPTKNPFQATFGGFGGSTSIFRIGDAFIAKLNPSGQDLLFSTYLGGPYDDAATAIAVDSSGNAYVCGGTLSFNFPTTQGAYQMFYHGAGGEPVRSDYSAGDGFVAKFTSAGQPVYVTYLGGSSDDLATSIAVDTTGNAYVAGYTLSPDFPTSTGAYQKVNGGREKQNTEFNFGDAFIAKFNPTGGLVFSTLFGGTGDDAATGIAVDGSGNVYFTGFTTSTNLTTSAGAFQPDYGGYTALPQTVVELTGDAYVAKLNSTGTALMYLSYLGGGENDSGMAIAVDAGGNAYVTGFTDSTNFPTTTSALQPKFGGDGGQEPNYFYGDAFLAVVNPTATSLVYSSYLGGTKDDIGFAIALDGAGDAYVTGNTISTNFPTSSAIQKNFGGSLTSRAFVKGDAFYSVFSGFAISPVSITSVTNAFGNATTIGPNTWVAIKGTDLAPDTRTWGNSDFVNNQLPTELDGASVTMNGEKAYIYYISSTQINALTPPDLKAGPVTVQVTNGSASSPVFNSQAASTSPSIFVFDSAGDVVGQHIGSAPACPATLPYCDVGPATLYPGLTFPAMPGEEIIVYGNGFGLTSVPIVAGSETQSGNLGGNVQVLVNGTGAGVSFAGLVGPGLYQFNVTIPTTTPNGEIPIVILFNGLSTQPGTVVSVHQ